MKETGVHGWIRGRVQGVFFREYTRRKAEELGVSGWVRNRPDGSVEVFFQGEERQVAAMRSWLHTGSPLSRVDSVELSDERLDPGLAGFVIRYD